MASFKELNKGNWQVSFYCKDYLGNNIKYKKSGFKTKSLANKYAIEFINNNLNTENILFTTACDEYFKTKSNLKYNTLLTYKTIKNKLDLMFINKKIVDIKKQDILIALKKYENKPYTKKLLLKFLKKIFNFCENYKNLRNNIMKNFDMKIKVEPKKRKFYLFEDFKILDDILKENKNDEIFRLLINFLYYTGARIGEITALTFKDVDIKNETININKTKLKKFKVNSPKTKDSYRIIKLPKVVINLYLKIFKNYKFDDDNFIFSLSVCTYSIKLKNYIKKYNLKEIGLHGFRHSHASLLIKKGIDLPKISKRLGHSSPQITLSIYTHLYNADESDVIATLDSL